MFFLANEGLKCGGGSSFGSHGIKFQQFCCAVSYFSITVVRKFVKFLK